MSGALFLDGVYATVSSFTSNYPSFGIEARKGLEFPLIRGATDGGLVTEGGGHVHVCVGAGSPRVGGITDCKRVEGAGGCVYE